MIDHASQRLSHRFSIAPMMEWTDRHCRFFHRLMTKHARGYTEMVTTNAVLFGPKERLLSFSLEEKPLSLQLGGSDPKALRDVAQIALTYGYDEINLNVGCPSDRVQNGRFGACLMLEPQLVAQCVSSLKQAVNLPITVKCRIGVDDQDTELALDSLADALIDVKVDALFVHARKAWLKGLSPKENRDIPPLDYERVYRLKQRLPDLTISINGGINSLSEAHIHLKHVDGVMMGRAAYHNPDLLLDVDSQIFGAQNPLPNTFSVIEAMISYIEDEIQKGARLHTITRHMLGAFQGMPGARAYRRHLATEGCLASANAQTLRDAADLVKQALDLSHKRFIDMNSNYLYEIADQS
jgi:tRNA-dihydrouridine synthase A